MTELVCLSLGLLDQEMAVITCIDTPARHSVCFSSRLESAMVQLKEEIQVVADAVLLG